MKFTNLKTFTKKFKSTASPKTQKKSLQMPLIKTEYSDMLLELVDFLNVDEFMTNPQLLEFAENIDSIKTCGIVKSGNMLGKRAEITLKNDTKFYATSFENLDNSHNLNKYLVIKEDSKVNGIGKVWDNFISVGGIVFALENCPFTENEKIISVINNAKLISEEVNFYTLSNKWFGKSWLFYSMGSFKDASKIELKTIVKPNYLKNLLPKANKDATFVTISTSKNFYEENVRKNNKSIFGGRISFDFILTEKVTTLNPLEIISKKNKENALKIGTSYLSAREADKILKYKVDFSSKRAQEIPNEFIR